MSHRPSEAGPISGGDNKMFDDDDDVAIAGPIAMIIVYVRYNRQLIQQHTTCIRHSRIACFSEVHVPPARGWTVHLAGDS